MMINGIKSFKHVFSKKLTTIFVIVIALFAIYFVVNTGSGIWLFLASLLPIMLVAGAAIGLQLKDKSLAAHLVLFLTAYLSMGTQFIGTLLSSNFTNFALPSFSLNLIVGFVIFVYLIIYILSYILDGKVGMSYTKSPVVMSAIIAFTYFFIRSGFSVAVLKIVPPVIALLFGANVFAIMLLLAGVADVPFILLDKIFNSGFANEPLSYFIFAAFGLYLAYGASTAIIKSFKK